MKSLALLSAAVVLVGRASAAFVPPYNYSSLVIIGDSLSDTGRSFAATGGLEPSDPAYYKGRYSDGPLWVEFLAKNLKATLYNHAFSGATSDNSRTRGMTINTKNGTVTSVDALHQVDEFIQSIGPRKVDVNTTLVAIQIGGNDATASRLQTPGSAVITTIGTMVDRLHAAGIKHILVNDIYDAASLPAASLPGYALPFYAVALWVRDFNSKLQSAAQTARIPMFSWYNTFQTYLNNPNAYGFNPQQTRKSCFTDPQGPQLFGIVPGTPRSVCTKHEDFIWWDSVHPSTKAHSLTADAITRFLAQSPIF